MMLAQAMLHYVKDSRKFEILACTGKHDRNISLDNVRITAISIKFFVWSFLYFQFFCLEFLPNCKRSFLRCQKPASAVFG